MKIILMQQIQLIEKGEKLHDFRTITKEFESNVIPHKGDFITDSFYKNPYEYEVISTNINYPEDKCYISLYGIALDSDDTARLKKWVDLAKKHGWNCDLDVK